MTDEARARLETMVRTSNGFEIAEPISSSVAPANFSHPPVSDLGFHIANPLRDRELLELAAAKPLS